MLSFLSAVALLDLSALQTGTVIFSFPFPINKKAKQVFSVCPFWHEAVSKKHYVLGLVTISVSNQQRKYTENKARSF